jgi:hypothetical protein
VFQASSAARIFWIAVSSVNGGSGGRASDIWTSQWSCAVPREHRTTELGQSGINYRQLSVGCHGQRPASTPKNPWI